MPNDVFNVIIPLKKRNCSRNDILNAKMHEFLFYGVLKIKYICIIALHY